MSDGKELATTHRADLWKLSQAIIGTPFQPPGLKSAEAVYACIQYGIELGFQPMQALRSIAVINGRPSVYGDGFMAIARASGRMKGIKEEFIGTEGTDSFGCRCTVSRTDTDTPTVSEFTVADAKRARLWGKAGPWTDYPKRMLQFRARGFAIRDAFADYLQGIVSAEEAGDTPTMIEPARNQAVEARVEAESALPAPDPVDDAAFIAQVESASAPPPVREPPRPAGGAPSRGLFNKDITPASVEDIDAAMGGGA